MSHKIAEHLEREIVRLYTREGLGSCRIGALLKVNVSTVNTVRRRVGIEALYKPGAPKGNRNASGPHRRT